MSRKTKYEDKNTLKTNPKTPIVGGTVNESSDLKVVLGGKTTISLPILPPTEATEAKKFTELARESLNEAILAANVNRDLIGGLPPDQWHFVRTKDLNPLFDFDQLDFKEKTPYDAHMSRIMIHFLKSESVRFATDEFDGSETKEVFMDALIETLQVRDKDLSTYKVPISSLVEKLYLTRLDAETFAKQITDEITKADLTSSKLPGEKIVPEFVKLFLAIEPNESGSKKREDSLKFNPEKIKNFDADKDLDNTGEIMETAKLLIDGLFQKWTDETIKRNVFNPLVTTTILNRDVNMKTALQLMKKERKFTKDKSPQEVLDRRFAQLKALQRDYFSVSRALSQADFAAADSILRNALSNNYFMALPYMYSFYLKNERTFIRRVPGLSWVQWAQDEGLLPKDVNIDSRTVEDSLTEVEVSADFAPDGKFPSRSAFLAIVAELSSLVMDYSTPFLEHNSLESFSQDLFSSWLSGNRSTHKGMNLFSSLKDVKEEEKLRAFSILMQLSMRDAVDTFAQGGSSPFGYSLISIINEHTKGKDSNDVVQQMNPYVDAMSIGITMFSSVLSYAREFIGVDDVEIENYHKIALDILDKRLESVIPVSISVDSTIQLRDPKQYIMPVNVGSSDLKKYPILSKTQEKKAENEVILQKTLREITVARYVTLTEQGGDLSDFSTDPAHSALLERTQKLPKMVGVFDLVREFRDSVMSYIGMEGYLKLSRIKTLNDIQVANQDLPYMPLILDNYEMVAINSIYDLLDHMNIEESPDLILKLCEKYPALQGVKESLIEIIKTSESTTLTARAKAIRKNIKFSEYPQLDDMRTNMLIVMIPKLDQHSVVLNLGGMFKSLNTLSETQLISEKITSAGSRIILPSNIAMVKTTREIHLRSVSFAFQNFLSEIASRVREDNPWLNVLESLSLDKLKNVIVSHSQAPDISTKE